MQGRAGTHSLRGGRLGGVELAGTRGRIRLQTSSRPPDQRWGGQGWRVGVQKASRASFHVHDSSRPTSALWKNDRTWLDMPSFEPGPPLPQTAPLLGRSSPSPPEDAHTPPPRLWLLACSGAGVHPHRERPGCTVRQRRPIPGLLRPRTLGQAWKLGQAGLSRPQRAPGTDPCEERGSDRALGLPERPSRAQGTKAGLSGHGVQSLPSQTHP